MPEYNLKTSFLNVFFLGGVARGEKFPRISENFLWEVPLEIFENIPIWKLSMEIIGTYKK